MKAVKIKENVYWVGGIDWELRNFHGYLTQRGSTYNAYLIIDKKITLIDTVKHYLADEMLERIASVIDPSKIDVIVSNHVEMDHSGALPFMMNIVPNATIVTSPNGEKGLRAHYKNNFNFKVVQNGESFNIGERDLTYVLTPMIHWPDNMVCYSAHDKILFSNDAFGQHIASPERFDDEYPIETIIEEAKKYYANIVLPYSPQVQKAIETVKTLDIDTIAPSHGIIWRSKIKELMAGYAKWSGNVTENRAVIIYDSMWNSTKSIAHECAGVFESKGIQAQLLDLKHNHISDIMTEVTSAKYIFVGSPTLNNGMLPSVSAFLTYFKGLAPKNRIACAFGSYGWGGQSIPQVHEILSSCGFTMLDPIKVQYVPDENALKNIRTQLESAL